ncbi:hypothetical protein BH10BAC2_BH10BAC2_40220 [soil metagenome]
MVCFYNDAYRFSLGNDGKHPLLLGMKGEQAFPETWHIVKPPIDQVLADGEATWSEDQYVPIYRDGALKDAYWTFSFSPVKDESNNTAGVFLTLIETTEKFNSLKKLEESNDQLSFAIEATELGTFDFNPLTNKFNGNNRLKDWFGLPHEAEIDLSLAMEVILEKDRSRVAEAIQNTLQFESGGLYDIEYGIINPVTKLERIVRAKGKAWFGEDKTPYRFNGTLQDITEQAIARRKIEESERRFRNLILQAPVSINTLIGPFFILDTINKTALEIWGKSYDEVFNKPLFDSSPELEDSVKKILHNVYTTGEPFIANEIPVQIKRTGKPDTGYFNTVYQPLRDLDNKIYGIIAIGTEVTETVNARKLIEANALMIENIYMNAPASICTFKGPKHIYELVNPAYQKLFDKRELVGKPLLEALPELEGQGVDKILDNVYNTGEIFTSTEIPVMLATSDNLEPEQRYYNTTMQPIYDETNKITGVVNFGYDVTEQIVARKQIEASEKRFSNILEQSLMAVSIFKGPEMRIAFANEPMIVMLGKGKDIIGKPLIEVLPELEGQSFPKLLDDVYASGVPYYGYEMPGTLVRNGKAEETYFNFVYQPYREVDNSITGITVIGTEVGVQVLAKKQIEESENRFRTFADSIQNLAWIANAEGFIYWYNQRWYDYTGTTLKEMEGSGWQKVHHPDKVKKVTEFLSEAWKKDEAFELTCQLRRYDGKYRWFITRAYPAKDANGNIERWIGTNTDIHEQKEKEQQKDEFISIASHEMKTPLTIAKGYLELLLQLFSEENQTTFFYANKANQAVGRLNSFVTELLDASKIQNGKLDYNISMFDFNEMMDEAIENIQLTAKNHRLQKTANSARQIKGDRDRLQQVMINLLSNAVKYSPNGEKVIIKVEEQDGNIQVSVQDFGVGMSSQHLDKVFDRYYRVPEHAVYFQGLGIGLYISKNIIERHQGKMWAESELEKGSTFYFTLPL